MKQIKILFIIFILLSTFPNKVAAQIEDVRVSILTCGPGKDIYTLFGHTAIRVTIPQHFIDNVYNYGLFDFSKENFELRFALGQTDYQLGRIPYEYFIKEYRDAKRDVWEQELNLTLGEKVQLIVNLDDNLLPENIIYRYNFFYNNCATKPLEQVSRVVQNLRLPANLTGAPKTFREVINRYSAHSPWDKFGMNFCIGSKGDKKIGIKELTFAPIELMKILDKTVINDSIKLTQPIQQVLEFEHEDTDNATLFNPIVVFSLLLLIVLLYSRYQYKTDKRGIIVDAFIFTSFGIAGLILAFLVCFSVHPAISPNYLLFVFHPLHLIWVPIFIFKGLKSEKIYYHYANIAVLTLFILFFALIPQKIELAILPLAGCLWVRSFTNILISKFRK